MIFLSGNLPASKTYAVRTWHFLQVLSGDHPTLTVNQSRSARPNAAVATETYDVEEDTSELAPCRTFLLRKHSDEETIYAVTIGPQDHCTCDAARAGLACKHTAAMRAVVESGCFLTDDEAMQFAHG